MLSNVKDLSDAVISRVTNPFVGVFLVSYCLLNLKGLATFFVVSNTEKQRIISAFDIYSDVPSALYLSLSFIVVNAFIWPATQFIIKFLSHKLIVSHLNKLEAEQLSSKRTLLYKASDEYVSKLHYNQLEDWVKQREIFEADIQTKQEKISLLESTNKDLRFESKNLQAENDELLQAVSNASEAMTYNQEYLDSLYAQIHSYSKENPSNEGVLLVLSIINTHNEKYLDRHIQDKEFTLANPERNVA